MTGEKWLVSAGLGVLLPTAFFGMSAWSQSRAVAAPPWMRTALDGAVPFVPAATWVYISWYVAPASFLFLDGSRFRRAWLSEAVAFGACLVGYVVWPVTMERPAIATTDVGSLMLAMLYAVDPPVNLFPSFHAAVAGLIALHLQPRSALHRWAIRTWMTGVCVACVVTRQHFVVDVIAGLLVACAAYVAAAVAIPSETDSAWRRDRLGRTTRPCSAIVSEAR